MQRLSQACFDGWSTSHRPRWWEYPWVLAQVDSRRHGRKPEIADFGAGKSPLPIALRQLRMTTTVVDPDAQQSHPTGLGVSEWDWVGYEAWDVVSLRAGVETSGLFDSESLGFVVSVSVLEHVPAAVRRAGLANMTDYLMPDGLAIVTIDVAAGTRALWNRVLGIEVELDSLHGTVDDVIQEAAAVGLRLLLECPCPLSTPQVDVLGLVFRRDPAETPTFAT